MALVDPADWAAMFGVTTGVAEFILTAIFTSAISMAFAAISRGNTSVMAAGVALGLGFSGALGLTDDWLLISLGIGGAGLIAFFGWRNYGGT